MAQYIDKSALVAEIERRKNQFVSQAEAFRKIGKEDKESYFAALASNMNSLSCFLDTLEVKEVGVDLGDPKGDIGVKRVWDSSNSLEISRNGNSHNGETLEEAAKNHKSAILIVSPQWTSEVENAFKASAEWQKEQIIDKACEWLEEHLLDFWSQKITNTDYFIEDFKQAMNK